MSLVRAIRIAERSSMRRFKTGAVIVSKDGKVLAVGWSHMATRSMQEYHSMHAECHAIIRARATRKVLKGSTIYIATLSGKSGSATSAKPCLPCLTLIESVGIREIIYTERKVFK